MGTPVLVLGRSGTGKSCSIKNLPEDMYSLIEVNGKKLPFKTEKKYVSTDDPVYIQSLLAKSKNKILIVDDSQYIMANEFMRKSKDKGFQKFTEIGVNFWNIINSVEKLASDVIVYFLHHTEIDQTGEEKAKTIGKMLDEKITLEGMFTIVLKTIKNEQGYFFSTQNSGTDTVKTPIGMFTDELIPNDLYAVDGAIRAYYDISRPVQAQTTVIQPQPLPVPPQVQILSCYTTEESPEEQLAAVADADFYGEPRIPQEERTVPQRLLEILETKEQGVKIFLESDKNRYLQMLGRYGIDFILTQARTELAARLRETKEQLNPVQPQFDLY